MEKRKAECEVQKEELLDQAQSILRVGLIMTIGFRFNPLILKVFL